MSKVRHIFSLCIVSSTILFANVENKNITTNELYINTTEQLKQEEISYEEKVAQELNQQLKNKKSFLLTSKRIINSYYKTNNYNAFWFNESGIKEISLNLLDTIKNDPVLKPYATKAFKLDKIIESLNKLDKSLENNLESMIEIDFMLTEIYDRYMKYLSKGTIDWDKFKKELKELDEKKEIIADWEKYNININSKDLLIESIKSNSLNIAFEKVNYTYPKVQELINALYNLEELSQNGGYTKIPATKTLRVGDKSETIQYLRKRLLESNDLAQNCEQEVLAENLITNNISINKEEKNITNDSKIIKEIKLENCENIFDEDLKKAVISFQRSHGLDDDGVVGPMTQKHLNISVERKIEQIRLNLERMRWLPRSLGEKFLIVNIPDYKLKMFDNGEKKLEMPVVVGQRKHPTPIFSNEMSYIVLNPYWRIPKRISQKELIPKLVENPNYVNDKGIKVKVDWTADADEVDTNSVNWNEYLTYLEQIEKNKKNKIDEPIVASEEILSLPNLRFVQEPSDNNPLGRIKFMFPNRYSVYMHDTPSKSLFRKKTRAFSHGCIRLGHPKELLKLLSTYNKNINLEEADEILKDIEKKDIGLNEKIPVHIVYLTSWIDENGKLQFRDDIYRYDYMQKKYLF